MKNAFVFLMILFSSIFVLALQPAQIKPYYGNNFYSAVLHQAKDNDLKEDLKVILKSGHLQSPDELDQIVPTCEGKNHCQAQTSLGYEGARKFIFGFFYLIKNNAGYGIQEMYCNRIYQGVDFKKGNAPGPGLVPDNTVINIEHTWPQSRFTGKYPKNLQKADLHHLFPTDSKMNSLRGNTIFGEVAHDSQKTTCNASKYGTGSAGGREIFEPPQNHKGHVARALFYFSIRYDIAISPNEEVVLKKWNEQFPVDAVEMARNEEIYKVQGNRNPFIDYPELAEDISDF